MGAVRVPFAHLLQCGYMFVDISVCAGLFSCMYTYSCTRVYGTAHSQVCVQAAAGSELPVSTGPFLLAASARWTHTLTDVSSFEARKPSWGLPPHKPPKTLLLLLSTLCTASLPWDLAPHLVRWVQRQTRSLLGPPSKHGVGH